MKNVKHKNRLTKLTISICCSEDEETMTYSHVLKSDLIRFSDTYVLVYSFQTSQVTKI